MSGGRFNYINETIGWDMAGKWKDEELNELFHDLFCAELWEGREGGLAMALDFWLSDDIGEDAYREYVAAFKKKWFGRTPDDRAEFYQQKLQERCDELKKELGA